MGRTVITAEQAYENARPKVELVKAEEYIAQQQELNRIYEQIEKASKEGLTYIARTKGLASRQYAELYSLDFTTYYTNGTHYIQWGPVKEETKPLTLWEKLIKRFKDKYESGDA